MLLLPRYISDRCCKKRFSETPVSALSWKVALPLSCFSSHLLVCRAGAFFTIFTTILVFLDYRYGGTKQTSEQVVPCSELKYLSRGRPCCYLSEATQTIFWHLSKVPCAVQLWRSVYQAGPDCCRHCQPLCVPDPIIPDDRNTLA